MDTNKPKDAVEALDVSSGSPFFGAILHIDYQRVCPIDKSGMVNIDCDGPRGWSYADVGSHHGIQIAEGVDEEKTMRFCDALSMLVKEHFGEVTTLLPYNVTATAEFRRTSKVSHAALSNRTHEDSTEYR